MSGSSSSYRATERILGLLRHLEGRARQRAAVNDLAAELGVSRRTIVRWGDVLDDLAAMDPEGPRIARVLGDDGRAWLEVVRRAEKTRRFTAYQLAGAHVAIDALDAGGGHLLADCGRDVVEAAGPEAVLRQAFLTLPTEARTRPPDAVVDGLLRGVVGRRRVRFRRAGAARWVELEPWTVVLHRDALYVYGRDVGRDAMRTWAVSRIEDVRLLGAIFEVPADYEPADVFSGAFGIWASNEPPEPIRVRFSASVASAARTRAIPGACWTWNDDGSLDLAFRAAVTPELVRWVLGWGGELRVVAPASLVEAGRAQLQRTLEAWETP